jgi:CheY-like chemotaxis protein
MHKLATAISLSLEQRLRPDTQALLESPSNTSDVSWSTISTCPSTAVFETQATAADTDVPQHNQGFSHLLPASDSPSGTPTNKATIRQQPKITRTKSIEHSNAPPADHVPVHLDTFLLVDDNTINLRILSAHMKRRNATFQTANDGQKALDIYSSDPCKCRVIIMDISMPVMDGLTSTRAIRKLEKQRGLSASIIIIVSGLASADIQRETQLSGADAYLAKPVGLKELDSVMMRLKLPSTLQMG